MKMSEVFDLPLLGGGAVAHAVNNHDQLVEAVEEAARTLEGCRYSEMPMARKLREILKTIKGESNG